LQRAEDAPVQREPAPQRDEPRYAEPRAEQPKIDPKTLLESDGLVMIETDRSKAPAYTPVQEERQPLGRPRRERPKPPPQEDVLEQVETRK